MVCITINDADSLKGAVKLLNKVLQRSTQDETNMVARIAVSEVETAVTLKHIVDCHTLHQNNTTETSDFDAIYVGIALQNPPLIRGQLIIVGV